MKRTTMAAASLAVAAGLVAGGQAASATGQSAAPASHTAHVSVFATGFNNPRGLAFGPNGDLYVAEGGLGGSHSTVGKCRQASGAAAPYTGSTNNPVLGGRISQVTPGGARSVVVRGLPSSQTSPRSAVSSAASRASRSSATTCTRCWPVRAARTASRASPTASIRVHHDGSWALIANLSASSARIRSRTRKRPTSSPTAPGTA